MQDDEKLTSTMCIAILTIVAIILIVVLYNRTSQLEEAQMNIDALNKTVIHQDSLIQRLMEGY